MTMYYLWRCEKCGAVDSVVIGHSIPHTHPVPNRNVCGQCGHLLGYRTEALTEDQWAAREARAREKAAEQRQERIRAVLADWTDEMGAHEYDRFIDAVDGLLGEAR
jgi:hypothetical protein